MTTFIIFIILTAIIILNSQQQVINDLEKENQVIIELYLQSKEKDISRMDREMRNLHG